MANNALTNASTCCITISITTIIILIITLAESSAQDPQPILLQARWYSHKKG